MLGSLETSILKQKGAELHQQKCSKTRVGDGLGRSEKPLGINETNYFG
jgi:hypothetical protein